MYTLLSHGPLDCDAGGVLSPHTVRRIILSHLDISQDHLTAAIPRNTELALTLFPLMSPILPSQRQRKRCDASSPITHTNVGHSTAISIPISE